MATPKEKHILIKEAELTNNCPVCYSNTDLVLLCHQKIKQNRFYMKITKNLTKTIQCKKCSSTIYPVDWTDDIERVFDFYNKKIEPRRPSIKFTNLFYGLIIGFIVIATALVVLKYQEII
ncbi:hypothetical protein GTQ40_09880 [Flavobacteriaceae bacterium R38]|nr:hypothetical protein [Flavobacteriaceae bacterium R38]